MEINLILPYRAHAMTATLLPLLGLSRTVPMDFKQNIPCLNLPKPQGPGRDYRSPNYRWLLTRAYPTSQ